MAGIFIFFKIFTSKPGGKSDDNSTTGKLFILGNSRLLSIKLLEM